MRIKSIELNGFKSFMQKTVLELPSGITAIVGPNGCGKSNIVDAIRWVIGEQSPKHLRGTAMEDVIFNGNAQTGPQGMAEVSILLERSDAELEQAAAPVADEELAVDGLPPELARLSEILVTRRYFRSGESEYFINRAPCRMKDITELFLGTGVGTKAYAIIEQGRVDQLVNAKPEELRLFLEEAAGTTRFRSRRIAAERKMERTRDNLTRVQDVLRELERQIASLERQAKRAEEYHRIKNELRAVDLAVMSARQHQWGTDVARLSERLVGIQRDEAVAQEELHRSRDGTGEIRARRSAASERLRAVDEEHTQQRLAAGQAQERVASLASRQADLTTRAVSFEQERARLQGRVEALAADTARLQGAVTALAEQADAGAHERETGAQRVAELMEQGPPLEESVEAAKSALLDALSDQVRVRNMTAALQQRREELEGRRQKLEDEQRRLGERLHENQRGVERIGQEIVRTEQERAQTGAKRAQVIGAQARHAAEEEQELRQVELARATLTQLHSRAESLRELQARYEGCTRGAASLLARDEDSTLLAGVLRVPHHLERAVAAALGVRLSQVVVADSRAALAAVSWLKETGSGSASVVPREAERRAAVIVPAGRRLVDLIEVDTQHWSLAEALLGHVLVADTLDEALAVWRAAPHAVTVVTPIGDAIDSLGVVTGGSEPPLEETLLARARELRELESQLDAQAQRVARAEQELAVTRGHVEGVTRELAALSERLQALQLEAVTQEKDRERLDAERSRIVAELEVGALETRGLLGQGGQVADELTGLEHRLERAEGVAEERRRELGERQALFTRWREDYGTAEHAHTEAAVRAAAVVERLRAVQGELTRSEAEMGELQERLRLAELQATEARGGAAQVLLEATDTGALRAACEAQVQELARERERLLEIVAETEQALAADDAAERVTQDRLLAFREERSQLEVQLAERRFGLEHLASQLAERYGLEIPQLSSVEPVAVAQEEEFATRAEALRTRLGRLGDVNPGAVAELQELNERRGFLATQREDLERSLEDLRRTISKLARTSRQRFEATFVAANEKLQELFPKLFPGGKARLELVEIEESEDPGVEIVVQPEGKKLQSLSLLSGGEKAMTAVGLILSLFLIRPTPFCLLDEVDAPLDEANIGRFNQLVREMAATSQFLLITHNRRTMEAADTLYGITMEQAGVSKVVSVRLSEAA